MLASTFPTRDPLTVRECGMLVIDPEFPDSYYLDDILPSSPLLNAYQRHGDVLFSMHYIDLLEQAVACGEPQFNARTGSAVRTLLHQRLRHETLFGLPLSGVRRVHPHVAAAELAWTLMATDDVAWLSRHTRIWDKFAIDGKVPAAYGVRWRKAFGRDQLARALDTLAKDPSSRQVVVQSWDPRADGLDAASRALPPCPIGFTLQVLDGRLSCAVHLRSSDLACGLPYDTMVYALLVDAIATELGLARGLLTMQLDHAHVYESHVAALGDRISVARRAGCAPMPHWPLSRIEAEPDAYVTEVRRLAADVWQPEPCPIEAIGAAS